MVCRAGALFLIAPPQSDSTLKFSSDGAGGGIVYWSTIGLTPEQQEEERRKAVEAAKSAKPTGG